MTDYTVRYGRHTDPTKGRCAMEWVSYLAGEKHSDSPECVSLCLRSFSIALNDKCSHEQRQQLRPYLARMIGTFDDGFEITRNRLVDQSRLGRPGVANPDYVKKHFHRYLALLEEMLPTVQIQMPVVEPAEVEAVCGVPVAVA